MNAVALDEMLSVHVDIGNGNCRTDNGVDYT